MAATSRNCPQCGRELAPDARFCRGCGQPVAVAPTAPQEGYPPPGQPYYPTQSYPPQGYPPESYPPQPGPSPAGPPRSPRRSPVPLAALIACALLVLAGVAVVFTTHPFSHNETASDAGNSSAQGSPSGPPAGQSTAPVSDSNSSTAPVTPQSSPQQTQQQQAATNLAGMLAQSVSDRTAIVEAVSDVNSCGPNLNQDPQVFESAADSRRTLLADLASLDGRSALSAAMLQDLANAWTASIAADQDFAEWANDEINDGCTPDDSSDPGYQAATTPDNDATYYKQAFAALWDPIAAQYGLIAYQWNQL